MDVLLIHGFGEDQTVWSRFLTLLPSQHRYFTPDYATLTDCRTIDDYVNRLGDFVRERHIENGVLIGHSMGGYIALAFAEKYPAKILGLGLFHSSAYADDEERKATRLKTIEFIEKHGSEEFIKDFYPKMFTEVFRKKNKDLIEKQIERYSSFPKEALSNAQLAMRNRPDTTKVLRQADYPVMIIAGDEDKFVSPESAKEQMAWLKKGYTDTLEGVAHAGMFENPEACAKIIDTFLNACEQ